MIDEDRTIQLFGYSSTELMPGSHKRVVMICEECGRYTTPENRNAKELCRSCSMIGYRNPFYGKQHTNQARQKMRDNSPHIHGEDHHRFGTHPSDKTLQRMREVGMQRMGETAGNWQGGPISVICDYCGAVIERGRSCIYPHNFCNKYCWNEYISSDAGGIMFSAANQGVSMDDWNGFAIREPRDYVKHESLCMQMNERFVRSDGHHLSPSIVIYIPYELHRHITHNIKTGLNMGEINMLAIQYVIGRW